MTTHDRSMLLQKSQGSRINTLAAGTRQVAKFLKSTRRKKTRREDHESQPQPLNAGDLAVQESIVVDHRLGAAELLDKVAGIVAVQRVVTSGVLITKTKKTVKKNTKQR